MKWKRRVMKRKLFTIAMICVFAAGLSACSQKIDNQQSDHAGNLEKTIVPEETSAAASTGAAEVPVETSAASSADETEQIISHTSQPETALKPL